MSAPLSRCFPAFCSAAWIALGMTGCDWMPGKPKEADIWRAPSEERNFVTLYDMNCLGCHGNGKTLAGSLAMNNSLYLAIISRDELHKIIAEGVAGSLMPAFGHVKAGELNDAQIDTLTDGIYKWGPGKVDASLPPYRSEGGDANRGTTAYNTYCSKCHGADGKGGSSGPILDPDYLQLVSDQYLRSVVIAGRPELGMPDFRHYDPNKAMSPEEVSDVVAWMSKHRPTETPAGEKQASVGENK
jgi:cytochrome c oxidase cbb3-type subunit III